MINQSYVKDTLKLENCNDEKISKYRDYLKNKIEQQFGSYSNVIPEEVNGYYFKSDSNPSKDLAKTKEIKEFIKRNKQDIIDGTLFHNKLSASINFPIGDWHYSIGKADIIDCYFDNNKNLHLILADTYDFNANENNLIEAGRLLMQEGELKARFNL